jgi:hypothetical protein
MSFIPVNKSAMTRRQLILSTAGILEAGCRSTQRAPQPAIRFTEAPFTRILPNRKWLNATHLGSDYAALLVELRYRPDRSLKILPAVGGLVAAVSVTKGASVSPSPTLQFSGYEWRIRNAVSSRGGRNNPYSADNAWTDAKGALHLRINKTRDRYECAEVALTRSLGYGTYSFLVRDISKLPPHVMLEMFTWDWAGGDQHNREMDVVIRRRVAAPNVIARFIVQPYQVTSNVYEFDLPPGTFSHSFRWGPGEIEFATSSVGNHKRPVAEHAFTLGVPSPGLESARIALFLLNGVAGDAEETEVVIERFDYNP